MNRQYDEIIHKIQLAHSILSSSETGLVGREEGTGKRSGCGFQPVVDSFFCSSCGMCFLSIHELNALQKALTNGR